jgi:hypothetical protein
VYRRHRQSAYKFWQHLLYVTVIETKMTTAPSTYRAFLDSISIIRLNVCNIDVRNDSTYLMPKRSRRKSGFMNLLIERISVTMVNEHKLRRTTR